MPLNYARKKYIFIAPEIGSLRMISGGVWSLRKTLHLNNDKNIGLYKMWHYAPEARLQ